MSGGTSCDRRVETDVLVVGGGGAGFRAAIAAREAGASATLLSKGPLGRCGATPMAGADFTLDGRSLNEFGFDGEPKDSPETFFSDIVHQGYYLNNQKLLQQYVSTAPARLQELIDWGVKIRGSEERAIYTTGISIMDALVRKARSVGAETLEDVMLIDLLAEGGRVTGALGLAVRTGELIQFCTPAVVMATGGWHKAFWPNTGMRDLSGEGISLAHQAGADIGNMEFITFCCNALLYPPWWRGSIATYILHNVAGGDLTNSAGESFLDKYDPYTVEKGTAMEWNKGFISYATAREVRDGKGSPHGGIYYGLGDVPWKRFKAIAEAIFPKWKYKALDISELGRRFEAGEPVEVGPLVEYFDGGIVVNERFETTLEGLFAAGECTLGPFGANRVAAAITEMLVHGVDAGENAAEYARGVDMPSPDEQQLGARLEAALLPLTRGEGARPAPLRRRVQEMAHSHLGPIRSRQELEQLIEFLEGVKSSELPRLAATSEARAYNKEWIDALELSHIVHLLETAARSALHRTESRGVHYREDYPVTDNDSWLQESIVKGGDGDIDVSLRPVTVTDITPPGGVTPFLDMMKKMMEAHSDVGGHH